MKDSKASKQLRKKPKAAKPKRITYAQAVKRADLWFSKLVRYQAADKDGNAECFTCKRVAHVSELQAGHFASRRYHATRWHPDNCRPQCVSCNLYGSGEQWLFGQHLDSEEPGRAAAIMRAAKQGGKQTVAQLVELASRFKEMALHYHATKHVDRPAHARRRNREPEAPAIEPIS